MLNAAWSPNLIHLADIHSCQSNCQLHLMQASRHATQQVFVCVSVLEASRHTQQLLLLRVLQCKQAARAITASRHLCPAAPPGCRPPCHTCCACCIRSGCSAAGTAQHDILHALLLGCPSHGVTRTGLPCLLLAACCHLGPALCCNVCHGCNAEGLVAYLCCIWIALQATHCCMLCTRHENRLMNVSLPQQWLSRTFQNPVRSCVGLSAFGRRARNYQQA